MATQIAAANGNLTAAATWGVVDATSLLDSEANNTALTTAYVSSSVFAPGAITVDGIAVKIATRNATPTGTMSVQLFNSTGAAAVAGTEVTVNVSDISVATSGENGWFFLKFAAPVLLLAATDYTVQAKTSSATQVNLYRNATANNWSRMLRTTTTGAPAAGDNFFVMGEWTAAATKTNRSVTMDSTAATDYGGGSTTLAAVGISNGGTITWGASAATNYILRISGILRVWAGGIYQQGTTGTPIPADSTAQLEFDCATDGDFGLDVSGTATVQGSPRTAANNSYFALLNTDEAAGQTVLGVDRSTGWKGGDEIFIASTSSSDSQSEERTLASDAGASTVTVTAGLTNAHSGTSPTQAEVALLTRNARIRSVSTTAVSYVRLRTTAVADFDWAEVRYIGLNSTGKRGIEVETTTGSANFKYCTIRNSEHTAFYITGTTVDHVTIDSCVMTNISTGSVPMIDVASITSGTDLTITGCVFINTASVNRVISLSDNGVTITNNRIIVNTLAASIHWGEQNARLGTVSGNIIHSCSPSDGLSLSGARGGVISSTTIYRLASPGDGVTLTDCCDVTFNGLTVFGCGSDAMSIGASVNRLLVRNGLFAGDSSHAQPTGINVTGTTGRLRFENCTFGVASGIFVAHSTTDFAMPSSGASFIGEIELINCVLASATEFTNKNNTGFGGRSCVRWQRVDGTTSVHKIEYPALGTVSYETTTFRSASPSERLQPSDATSVIPLRSAAYYYPVVSGKAITFAAYVLKDVTYNGVAPRLILLANPALGIDDDVLLDTHTAAAATWERLTGTQTPVAEEDGVVGFCVEVTGTAGSVYVDDLSAVSS